MTRRRMQISVDKKLVCAGTLTTILFLSACQGSFSASLNSTPTVRAPPAASAPQSPTAQAPLTASAGAAANQESAGNATSAKAIAAPVRQSSSSAPSAPVPASPVKDPCDIRRTDWSNFTYGKDKLKDGVKPYNSHDESQGGYQLFPDEITYGDLNKNGKPEAYVPLGACAPDFCSRTIWIFENDKACHPHQLFKLEAGGAGGAGGSVVGDRYVFKRKMNPNDETLKQVEVQYIGGHFKETKVTVIPNE